MHGSVSDMARCERTTHTTRCVSFRGVAYHRRRQRYRDDDKTITPPRARLRATMTTVSCVRVVVVVAPCGGRRHPTRLFRRLAYYLHPSGRPRSSSPRELRRLVPASATGRSTDDCCFFFAFVFVFYFFPDTRPTRRRTAACTRTDGCHAPASA